MAIIFIGCVALLAGISFWSLQRWMGGAYRQYQHAFQTEARKRLSEFFLFLDPTQLWTVNIVASVGIAVLVYLLSGAVSISLACGLIALLSPQYFVGTLKRRRLASFDQQLPDLLSGLAGALRAGAGVQSALRHIVPQSPAPLAQEFGLMLREQRMGVSFEHALAALYRRMPTEGAALVVSCLTIAAQSGGSLAETLDGIADALRARLHLLGRIQALTSQGRMQAWVMAGLPFALALALSYLDPESMSALWGSPLGWAVLAVVGMLEFMGILFIRRIVNIDV